MSVPRTNEPPKIIIESNRLKSNPGIQKDIIVTVENQGNTLWRESSPEDDPPAFGGESSDWEYNFLMQKCSYLI